MKKQQVIDKIELAWQEFQAAVAGLTPEQMLQPGAVGEWSVKDILAHVSAWEQEAIKYLPLTLTNARLPRYKDLYGGIDAFNAQATAKARLLSLEEVLAQMEAVHQELLALVGAAPEELFQKETRFRRRIKLDTFSHYPVHSADIRRWRESS